MFSFLLALASCDIQLVCMKGTIKNNAYAKTIQAAINLVNRSTQGDYNGNICTIAASGQTPHSVTESSITFHSNPDKIILNSTLLHGLGATYFDITNVDVVVELNAQLDIRLHRTIAKLNELISDESYFNMSSLLSINIDGSESYEIVYDGIYPYGFIFGATTRDNWDTITGYVVIEGVRYSFDEKYTVDGQCNSMRTVDRNAHDTIKEENQRTERKSHNVETAIWLLNFLDVIDSQKTYLIYPNNNNDVEVDESFQIENIPQFFKFSKTGAYGIKGSLDITNPGIRYKGVTSGLDLIIHSTGTIVNDAGDDGKTVVPIEFNQGNQFNSVKVYFTDLEPRSKLYVAVCDNNVPSASDFQVYVNGELWTDIQTEPSGTKSYLYFNEQIKIIGVGVRGSERYEGSGSSIQAVVDNIKRQANSLSDITLSLSLDKTRVFDEKVNIDSDLPKEIVLNFDDKHSGTIEFENVGIVVSGTAPRLSLIFHMKKERLTEFGATNSFCVILSQNNAFQLISIYYDDIYNFGKVYPAKISAGVTSYNIEVFVLNGKIETSYQKEGELLYFNSPVFHFILFPEDDDSIVARGDTIQECITELNSQTLSGKTVVIQPIETQTFNEVVSISFTNGNVPKMLKFDSTRGSIVGPLEIVNKGVIIKGSASQIKPILNLDQDSTGGDYTKLDIYIVELEAINSFGEITFNITSLGLYYDWALTKAPLGFGFSSLPPIVIKYDNNEINHAKSSKTFEDNTYFFFAQANFKVAVGDQFVKAGTISEAIRQLQHFHLVDYAGETVRISKNGDITSDEEIAFPQIPREVFFDVNDQGLAFEGDVELTDHGAVVTGKINGHIKLHNTGDLIKDKNELRSYVVKFVSDNQIKSVTYYCESVANFTKIFIGILTDDDAPVPPCTIVADPNDYWKP